MAEAIRVLVCDEDPDSRVALRRSLQRAALGIAGETGLGTEAISFAADHRPDVILIAVEEPVTRALDTAEGLANVLPSTPIVVYSSLADAQSVRRAMVFGARDYLVKPVQADTLREAVHRALSQEERRQMRSAGQLSGVTARGSVIAVVGAKGGIGKSVIAANLGLALRQETGKRVCVLDADASFGDIATLFDHVPSLTVSHLLDSLGSVDREQMGRFITTVVGGLDIIAGPEDDAWERCTPEMWARLVDLLGQLYEFVVIDTSGAFDRFTRLAMEQATLSLLVTSGEVSSIRATRSALGRIDGWGVDRDRVRVVINRTDQRTKVAQDDVEAGIGAPVFFAVPFDPLVTESVQMGQPVLLQRNSRFGESVAQLARLAAGSRTAIAPRPEAPKQGLKRILSIRGRQNDPVSPIAELSDSN